MRKVCGGEEEIRKYCFDVARLGGARVAEILGTEVMGVGFEGSRMTECAFTTVRLPLGFKTGEEGQVFDVKEAGKIQKWLNLTALKEFDTYLQISMHAGAMWVRLSGQIYVEVGDFQWVGERLKELCERVRKGDVGQDLWGQIF